MNPPESNADRERFRAALTAVPACQQRMADTDRFPAVDVSDTGEEYLFEFDVPGLKLEDLQISRAEAALHLNGERKPRRCGGENLRVERPAGSFARCLVLPADACGDEIHAILQDAVLELHVPRRLPPDQHGKSNIIPFEEFHYAHSPS